MSVYHLFWVVPLSWIVGVLTAAFNILARKDDAEFCEEENAEIRD